ncbi:MAG: thioredoxin domain-containing protein [Lentimicrobium sp.]
MKKIFLFTTLSIAILAFISCGRNQKTESSENQTDKEALSEQVVQLNGELFREMIWDYTSSPDQWKYKGNKPSVIDFYADWCKPCKIASPILEDLAKEYAGRVNFYKIDTDKEKELSMLFGIRTIPSFLFIPQEGEPRMTAGIAPGEEATRKMFNDYIQQFCLGNVPGSQPLAY